MSAELERQARDLLADETRAIGYPLLAQAISGGTAFDHDEPLAAAIRAIVRALESRATPGGGEVEPWTDEQCVAFMAVALRHVEYADGNDGPDCNDIRLGVSRALAHKEPK